MSGEGTVGVTRFALTGFAEHASRREGLTLRSLHARIMARVIGASEDFTARNGNVFKETAHAPCAETAPVIVGIDHVLRLVTISKVSHGDFL